MTLARALGSAVLRVLGFLWWFAVGLVLCTVLGVAVMGVWPVWVWITACMWSVYNIAAGSAQGLLRLLLGRQGAEGVDGGADESLRQASSGNDGATSDGPSMHGGPAAAGAYSTTR